MAQLTKTGFKAQTQSLFPTNNAGQISAADLREQMDNIADSAAFIATGKTAAPTANDDSANTAGNGVFNVGDIWVDETNDNVYVCVNNSTAAAVWIDVTETGSGGVDVSGTPADNQLAVFVDADTIEGDANLTWDGTNLSITGNITITGTVDGRDISVDGNKLDGIDPGAEANPTGAEIVTLLDTELGSNIWQGGMTRPDVKLVNADWDLALTDAEDILEVDTEGGAIVITIPTNATEAFEIGTVINITLLNITNTLTITADANVDLNGITAGSGVVDAEAYVGVSLYKRDTDAWVAQGRIGTVS